MSQGERELTGPGRSGKGAVGKVGQDTAHLSASSPRGPGLINCSSRVLLAKALSRSWRLSVQVIREQLLLPLDFCSLWPRVRGGGLGAEPCVVLPTSAGRAWERPSGPSPAVWLPEVTDAALTTALLCGCATS